MSARVVNERLTEAKQRLEDGDSALALLAASSATEEAWAGGDLPLLDEAAGVWAEAADRVRRKAVEAGEVWVVEDYLPTGAEPTAGCYLVRPPRVGVDAQALRVQLHEAGLDALVIAREPATREGLWPVVAVGQTTVRCKVAPPKKSERLAAAKAQYTAQEGDELVASYREPAEVLPKAVWFPWAIDEMGAFGASLALQENTAEQKLNALVEVCRTVPTSLASLEELRSFAAKSQ